MRCVLTDLCVDVNGETLVLDKSGAAWWPHNRTLIFADLHTFHVWDMADMPALLIGVDLLRQFETVDLDFGRSEVLFRVPGYETITGTRIPGRGDTARTIQPLS